MRRTSLQSDQNLRRPRVAEQQQLSIDICCRRPTSTANPPADAAAVDRRDRQTDRRADGHSFCDAYRVLCGPRDKTKATELPDRPLLLATFPLGPFLCLHLLLETLYLHTFVLSTPYPP